MHSAQDPSLPGCFTTNSCFGSCSGWPVRLELLQLGLREVAPSDSERLQQRPSQTWTSEDQKPFLSVQQPAYQGGIKVTQQGALTPT